jgi:hypothetical protein
MRCLTAIGIGCGHSPRIDVRALGNALTERLLNLVYCHNRVALKTHCDTKSGEIQLSPLFSTERGNDPNYHPDQ